MKNKKAVNLTEKWKGLLGCDKSKLSVYDRSKNIAILDEKKKFIKRKIRK